MQTLITFLVLLSVVIAFTLSNHRASVVFRTTIANNHAPPVAMPVSPFPAASAVPLDVVSGQKTRQSNVTLVLSKASGQNQQYKVQSHFGSKGSNGTHAMDLDKGTKQVVTAAVPVVPVVMSPNGISPPKFVYVPLLRRFAWVLQNIRPPQNGGSGHPDVGVSSPFGPYASDSHYSTRKPGSVLVNPEVPDIEIAGGGSQYPFHPPHSVTPASADTTTKRHPPLTQYEIGSPPMATLPTTITITTSTTASAQMKPIVTHRPPMATRSPMKRDSCVVEPPFCPSCLSKLSSSEPWFPYPPPLFIPNACSRCGTLQVILNRLPEEVTVFSDILKLASFGEIVDFNELLNDADGQMTLLAPSDAAFTYLPVSVDDLKQRLVRSPNEMRRFVLYHLLPGYVTSRDFKPNAWIATCLFDKSIYVNTDKQINGARLQSSDINQKYGSIHTLSRVLWPVPEDSVQLFLDANPFLSQFASWYRMFARVPKHDMVTVFAPTNAAFERIAPSIRKNLAKNDVLKARSVQKHIVPGLWFSSSMPSSGTVLTPMDGVSVTCMTVKYEFDDSHKRNKYQPQIALYTADKVLTFGSSRVIASDQFATNGVIHIVDKLHTDQLELCGFS